jgi:hypothetical protein
MILRCATEAFRFVTLRLVAAMLGLGRVEEIRGGTVPPETRNSFMRVNKIAVDSHADYADLCVVELGTK